MFAAKTDKIGKQLVSLMVVLGLAGSASVHSDPLAREMALFEMRSRVRRVFNRAAHEQIQASRRAALEAFRSQVRLQIGSDLTAARNEALDWTSDTRPQANTVSQESYDQAEQAARIAAFEASEEFYKQGYQQALAKAKKISREYREVLEAELRRKVLRAMLVEYRTWNGPESRSQRAAEVANQIRAEAEIEIARKVQERLVVAEREEFEKLQARSDEQAIETYRKLEEAAYETASEELEADQPVATEIHEGFQQRSPVQGFENIHSTLGGYMVD